ncbi:Broad specificity phosphatase PhoE [Treponema bryantii]|uniref:Broad specificity phosphatase PhoE n=1 Tax=Treponema bryantii TaxID=163 RepID=A0A1H9DEI4_9SPIR|nr:histidine phosphatase family protein [Treponema bryantii]SEQ11925.1 Broad specificity phosphatase PhoE [Treponema bryantii]
MTKVYFIRHAEPDFTNHNDLLRPLTPKGMQDRKIVTDYLEDKKIDVVLSSPFKRAVMTMEDFAGKYGFNIETIDDFHERIVGTEWIDNFGDFARNQWADFDYKLDGGESLNEVQTRNITALKEVLRKYDGKNIAVGTHGTALSTIINYYDKSFGYEDFEKIKDVMPWIVAFEFDGEKCVSIKNFKKPELWDAYNSDYEKLEGVTLIRDDEANFPKGAYHLVCEVLVRHVDGTYLLMKRSPNKNWPGMWEATAGGSALKGETDVEGALRELREETGVIADKLEFLSKDLGKYCWHVRFLCITDCDKNSVQLQEGETCDYKWLPASEILAMSDKELLGWEMRKHIV